MAFHHAHIPSSHNLPTPTSTGSLTLHATAPTDIWRKPPSHDVFNAPVIYKSLPISSFKSARVTVTGEWKTLFDQGGLVIVLPSQRGSQREEKYSTQKQQKRWIKAGIEFSSNRPNLSVVAADLWADWSIVPPSALGGTEGTVTLEMEREQEEDGRWGSVLKVLLLVGEEKTVVREVTWAFHDHDESEEMWVGLYAAKPTKDEREELVVKFEGFEVVNRD